jgi:hypothetical protein
VISHRVGQSPDSMTNQPPGRTQPASRRSAPSGSARCSMTSRVCTRSQGSPGVLDHQVVLQYPQVGRFRSDQAPRVRVGSDRLPGITDPVGEPLRRAIRHRLLPPHSASLAQPPAAGAPHD